MVVFDKIKLIIWDLDETFWDGTLSEGGIKKCDNVDLIKDLTDCGIINTICSKNDKKDAEEELVNLGIGDYFVFNSIDWTPKGPRIKNMLEDMGLRDENVLFIDDNIVNLNEAKHYSPGLMIAEPDIISKLGDYVSKIDHKDLKHKRLNQYKVLQKKQESRSEFTDNLSFLYSTDTRVEIFEDCQNEIDRIHELILRTNQLNYTKKRISREDLKSLLNDSEIKSGYIKVRDSFGEYGIIGFYALKNCELLHFLFSCRTIGQGVEQWVYAQLGYPKLEVNGKVINPVTNEPAPEWINQNSKREDENADVSIGNQSKILVKGPCDLSILVSYLNIPNAIYEFTYQGSNNNSIEHHNHSVNYLSFPFLGESEKKQLLSDCIFNDEKMFDTALFDEDIRFIILSVQTDPNLGIYRNKLNGTKLAFAEFCYPLTDPKNWPLYINKEICTYENDFSEEFLKSFTSKYDFIGQITPQEYIDNIKLLLKKINPYTTLCLLLGSEKPYLNNNQKAYEKREIYNQKVNSLLRELAKSEQRLKLISFDDYIQSQDDYLDNINHYKRHVYFNAANNVREIIKEEIGIKATKTNRFKLFLDEFASKFRYSNFRNHKMFNICRTIYHILRD